MLQRTAELAGSSPLKETSGYMPGEEMSDY